MTTDKPSIRAAVDAVREYLRADLQRCQPTCRVGCPCDGGMQDSATGAPDGAQEIVDIVLAHMKEQHRDLYPENVQMDDEPVPHRRFVTPWERIDAPSA